MGAETKGVACRLLVLIAALAALDIGAEVPLVFDDPTGLVHPRDESVDRLATPRADFVGFEVSGRKGEMAASAKVGVVLAPAEMSQHLDVVNGSLAWRRLNVV